jgi:osmotically inducible protein OsmC
MALSADLTRAKLTPRRIHTTARVHLENVEGSFRITRIELDTEGDVPGLDAKGFAEHAETAKKSCPVSVALAGVQISLNARLV